MYATNCMGVYELLPVWQCTCMCKHDGGMIFTSSCYMDVRKGGGGGGGRWVPTTPPPPPPQNEVTITLKFLLVASRLVA